MKRAITRDLAKIIPTIRCHGDFCASGRSEIVMPNLEVDGVGRIALPLLSVQGEQLVAVAERAPYGRGEETLVDTEVRRTWQIDAGGVHLAGQSWPKTLHAMIGQVAAGLGVTEPVTAELYKLLIYDTGSFFVEHRDTEKIPGMFATLVVALPSVSSGGELIVRHRGREVCLDLGGSDSATVSFAAFYADCVHEVRPVTSGYRLVLIYNLARAGRRQPSAPPDYGGELSVITALLRRWVANKDSPDDDSPNKLIYPLEHAYTPAELAFDALKNADAAAAGVLIRAANEAECDLHLALVSIEETGTAEYAGYASRRRSRWYRDRYEDDEDGYDDDFEIGELIERTLTISDWRQPDGSKPAITALPFEEDELCPPGSFDELEPDEQHFHEATGNEGATFERTYRRAAFVLWPRTRRLAVIHQAGLGVTLPYLSDLAARWEQSGESQASPQWHDAHTLAGYMLRDWPASRGYYGNGDQVICMVASLTQLRDTAHLDTLLDIMPAKWMYHGSENEALTRAAGLLLPQRASELVEQIIAWNAQMMPGACAGLLARIGESDQFGNSPVLLHPAATTLVQTLTGQRTSARPDHFLPPDPITPSLIEDLLTALARIDAPLLADLVVGHVLAYPASFDLDAIVVPAILTLSERGPTVKSASVQRLRSAALAHLRIRIAPPLAPPPDFARANPILCRCAHCAGLGRFLVDPTRREWVFKAAEKDRRHVESAITVHGCDVDCATSRVGRPYSLICTKNQASYERRVRQRKEDLRNLERLESVPEQGGQPGAGPYRVNVQERETDDER
ncbi:2OG-Fe(II) oxygenase [Cupriavidus sp. UYPR2.512]|uniref:2OG-Fe(II) oxygenase n=1 Tax=Cupriavidus sp. UYPR2.512 TaxID=1080187 RepID=UPI00037DF99E|nr:2OG-Fe(II) oxygenase [Cupriavidus sp. UYPR2.512]UIF88934.1 2OG-Fe(II) oxygenase [Cupriavidus necator]UIF89385.1 2OG-Fe(II) oxygenase [Cupriavidus necator]